MPPKRKPSPQPQRAARGRTGSLEAFFGACSDMASTAKMAPGPRASRPASPIDSPHMQASTQPHSPSASSSENIEEHGNGVDPWEDKDIRSHILSLPTKADLERFAHTVEKALRQDIADLQVDTAHLGGRVETLENQWEETTPALQALTEHCKRQDRRLEALLDQMDDFENRSRRVNIRIRGLPEATGPREIIPTLQGVFKQILGRQAPDYIEIDRAHRALRPPSDDPEKPRDIICNLHKYSLKEHIMAQVTGVRHVDFDGAQLTFFPDLSRRTLMQHRALKPLLGALHLACLSLRMA